jgi:hypothetical protein
MLARLNGPEAQAPVAAIRIDSGGKKAIFRCASDAPADVHNLLPSIPRCHRGTPRSLLASGRMPAARERRTFLLAMLMLASCGGGGSSSPDAPPAWSLPELLLVRGGEFDLNTTLLPGVPPGGPRRRGFAATRRCAQCRGHSQDKRERGSVLGVGHPVFLHVLVESLTVAGLAAPIQ